MSRVEYMAGVRRNAYLRKIVEHDMPVTEEQLEAEFRNTYGERVSVRHIQLATAADADRVMRELSVPGTDFSEVARRNSANPDTAPSGGRLRDFSREDPDVPALLREVAFDLELGAHSDPVRIGEWFQIVKLEARHAAADNDLAAVRGELETRILLRTSEPAMRELHRRLLEEAKVVIADPMLADEYRKKHPTVAGARQGQ
jgi:parvulin-like peptidyl-prolyl isomerase